MAPHPSFTRVVFVSPNRRIPPHQAENVAGLVPEEDDDGFRYDEEEEVLEEEEEVAEGREAEAGPRRRGRDLDWRVHCVFETNTEYFESDCYKELTSGKYSLRRIMENNRGDKELHNCKFARKRGYLPCQVKYRVCIDNSSEKIMVEISGQEHSHDRDPEHGNIENPHYFKWTDEQTAIVVNGCKNNLDPTNIRRNLRESNLFNAVFPTVQQLNNKIAHCRKKLFSKDIIMTGELRQAIADHLDVPMDLTQAYVVHHEVLDDQGDGEVRFVVTWSTEKMRARLNVELVQDDATYR